MSLATQNLKNIQLRSKLEKIVQDECTKLDVEPKNVYNIFLGEKNTGEKIKLPDAEVSVLEKITSRVEEENHCEVLLTHRNICICY